MQKMAVQKVQVSALSLSEGKYYFCPEHHDCDEHRNVLYHEDLFFFFKCTVFI